jgi:hypothetical protein
LVNLYETPDHIQFNTEQEAINYWEQKQQETKDILSKIDTNDRLTRIALISLGFNIKNINESDIIKIEERKELIKSAFFSNELDNCNYVIITSVFDCDSNKCCYRYSKQDNNLHLLENLDDIACFIEDAMCSFYPIPFAIFDLQDDNFQEAKELEIVEWKLKK